MLCKEILFVYEFLSQRPAQLSAATAVATSTTAGAAPPLHLCMLMREGTGLCLGFSFDS